MLALMLATLLHRGVSIWHEGEARRAVYDEAQAVLGRIARDLECTFAESGPRPGGATGVVHTRLLCDRDALGRQRLRFVRTLAGEDADPLTRGSAEGTPADGWSEYRDDRSDPGRRPFPRCEVPVRGTIQRVRMAKVSRLSGLRRFPDHLPLRMLRHGPPRTPYRGAPPHPESRIPNP